VRSGVENVGTVVLVQVFKFLEALEASEDVDVVFHDAA
jgi:hypothetical protein